MKESLERWGDAAPDLLRDAASIYQQEGPSELELERMLEVLELGAVAENRAAMPASAPRPKLPGRFLLGATTLSLCGLLLLRAPGAEQPSTPAPVRSAPNDQPKEAAPAPPQIVALELPEHARPPGAEDVPTAARTSKPAARRRSEARADPVAELTLLVRARRVLSGDPGRAYALTEQHRESYRRGALSEERELLAIEALVALGHRTAAEARVAQFARRFPGSVHARKLALILRGTAP